MKRTTLIPVIGQIALCALLLQACTKDDEANTSPSCEITAPSNGEIFKQGEIAVISVVADDSDGSIAEVEFMIDGQSKGSMSNSPYSYDWDTSDESIGNHTIKATCVDNEGASSSKELSVEIIEGGSVPVPEFTASPTDGDAPLTVEFTDQSTNSPKSWLWDFGDGNTSADQNPSNIYSETGEYTVALTASNEYGSETLSKEAYVTVKGIAADFSVNITGGTAPLTVVFTDESKSDPTSWLWEFGDGSSSTEQSPSHTYTSMGLYDVSLTVENDEGSDTETKSTFITVNGGDAGLLIDARDDQSYKIIPIGDQEWLASNLNFESPDSWWYDNSEALGDIYGRLYTWDVAINVCPVGWHLPNDDEWKILEGTVDTQFPVGDPEWDGTTARGWDAGSRLKSTDGWTKNNGTDDFGFKGLPGGAYYGELTGFDFILDYGLFWTATETSLNASSAYSRSLYTTYKKISRGTNPKKNAFSVRCIKD